MTSIKSRVYHILEAGHSHDWQSRVFEVSMATLIILNVIAFSLETVPSIHDRHEAFFRYFDIISILIFTAEYLLRLWVCTEHPPFKGLPAMQARWRFARSPFMVVDFLAIAPYFLSFIIPIDLRILRIMRLLRFFKLARFSPAFNTMLRVITRERDALLGVVIVMVGMIIIAASILYFIEGHLPDSQFATVPSAMWWAVVTLTTVGYGDVTPVTSFGKLIAGMVMICGLGFFALPIGIIASGFMEEFRRKEFIVSWGMAARVSLFHGMDQSEIADILTVLKARMAPAGSILAMDGERAGALFMIGSGAVEIVDADRPGLGPVLLEEGAFWGARSLLTGEQGETAIAKSPCDLIVLDQEDFRAMARTRPLLHKKLMDRIATVDDPFEDAVPATRDD